MAEGIFADLIHQKQLQHRFSFDSAGTANYHIGDSPDSRMQETAQKHGIELVSKARQLSISDFEKFDYILAMDQSNYNNIINLKERSNVQKEPQIYLMRAFDLEEHQNKEVPDPYYGGMDGFDEVYQILKRSCENFLDKLLQQQDDINTKH